MSALFKGKFVFWRVTCKLTAETKHYMIAENEKDNLQKIIQIMQPILPISYYIDEEVRREMTGWRTKKS